MFTKAKKVLIHKSPSQRKSVGNVVEPSTEMSDHICNVQCKQNNSVKLTPRGLQQLHGTMGNRTVTRLLLQKRSSADRAGSHPVFQKKAASNDHVRAWEPSIPQHAEKGLTKISKGDEASSPLSDLMGAATRRTGFDTSDYLKTGSEEAGDVIEAKASRMTHATNMMPSLAYPRLKSLQRFESSEHKFMGDEGSKSDQGQTRSVELAKDTSQQWQVTTLPMSNR